MRPATVRIAVAISVLGAWSVCPGQSLDSEVSNWTAPSSWAGDARTKSDLTSRAAAMSGPLPLVAVTPCRIMDTRPEYGFTGLFGPPAVGSTERVVPIPSSACGIPSSAKAYSLNVTVVPSGPLQYLTVWPTGTARPNVSTLNSFQGQIVANAAVVAAGTAGAISIYASGSTHLILDTNGYYTDSGSGGPVGPTGAAGATGPQGPAGPVGSASLTPGVNGPAGATGATGPQGPLGPVGATGPSGVAGPSGATGLSGAVGATGVTGATGAAGATGVAGLSGPQGATGLSGPAGSTGAAGAAGVAGATGSQGTAGDSGATGPTGSTGVAGATGVTGPVGVTGVTGATGAGGATGGPSIVAGATGPTGATGAAGAGGPTGPSGSAGTRAHAAFSADSGPTVVVLLGGTEIPLNSVVTSGLSSQTTVSTGDYRLSYCVRTASAVLAGARLVANGSPIAGSDIAPSASRSVWCRSVISSLNAGTTVSLQLYGVIAAATLLAPGGADLQIVQY